MRGKLALLGALVVAALISPVSAHEYTLGGLRIQHPWARPTPTMARNGVVYMILYNQGAEVDRLTGVASPVARRASLHTLLVEGDIVKMRPVAAVEVHPGEPSVFKPGGLHIMLTGLKAPLEEGTVFPMTLAFEKAGAVDIEVIVQRMEDVEHLHEHEPEGNGDEGS